MVKATQSRERVLPQRLLRTPTRLDRVALISPDLSGHRVVYAVALGQDIVSLGGQVVLLTVEPSSDSRTGFLLDAFPGDVVALRQDGGVFRHPRVFAGEVAALGAGTTLFLEADLHEQLLRRQLMPTQPRLARHRVGLFIRAGSRPVCWDGKAGRSRYARQPLSRDTARSQLFYNAVLPGLGLLDCALFLDEYFVAQRPRARHWLPDICECVAHPPEHLRRRDQQSLRALARFIDAHPGRPRIPYFGRAAIRRGYFELIRLADAVGGVFLHAGDIPDRCTADGTAAAARNRLAARGCIFETGVPLAGFDAARVFLQAAECAVLPYEGHYGSSGVMIQALQAGLPVLVPDDGLMARRVSDHQIGLVYRHGDSSDLIAKYERLRASGADRWGESIKCFLRRFGVQARRRFVAAALDGSPAGAADPLQVQSECIDESGPLTADLPVNSWSSDSV